MSRSGRIEISARKTAPGRVIRVSVRSMYSAVFFPGRTPGMNPPYFFMLSARSMGLKTRGGGKEREGGGEDQGVDARRGAPERDVGGLPTVDPAADDALGVLDRDLALPLLHEHHGGGHQHHHHHEGAEDEQIQLP